MIAQRRSPVFHNTIREPYPRPGAVVEIAAANPHVNEDADDFVDGQQLVGAMRGMGNRFELAYLARILHKLRAPSLVF